MTDAATEPVRVKLFIRVRSQALHRPEGCRFDEVEVAMRREGDAVILEPIAAAAREAGD